MASTTLIKHNKIKNTGIIFESITKQITSDILSGKDSKAINILKKYFVNTELGKEHKLYEALFKEKNISETRANLILETILKSSKNLNRAKLKKEKYNLIKELKESYNLDSLFRIKLDQYKKYAAFYTLLEIYSLDKNEFPTVSAKQIIENKTTLLEHFSTSSIPSQINKDDIMEEFKSYDKDTRLLTYKILVDNFNKKYDNLGENQKRVLKEYINSIESTPQLRNFYNKEILSLNEELKNKIKNTKSPSVKIKLEEVSNFMVVLDKNQSIKMDNLVDLLQYHSLIDELNLINE